MQNTNNSEIKCSNCNKEIATALCTNYQCKNIGQICYKCLYKNHLSHPSFCMPLSYMHYAIIIKFQINFFEEIKNNLSKYKVSISELIDLKINEITKLESIKGNLDEFFECKIYPKINSDKNIGENFVYTKKEIRLNIIQKIKQSINDFKNYSLKELNKLINKISEINIPIISQFITSKERY